MKISEHISALLYKHDCVIIPDFGGFVGNKKPAKHNKATHRFSPPFKELSFNQNLKNNDGLLANHIAAQENKPYKQANEIISGYVGELRSSINTQKRADIEKVGTLYLDNNNSLNFEQDYSVNYLAEAFGMGTLHAPQMAMHQPVELGTKLEAEPEPKIIKLEPKQEKPEHTEKVAQPVIKELSERKSNKAWRYIAAAAVLIPIGLYMGWLGTSTDLFRHNNNFTVADFNPFTEKLCPEYQPIEIPASLKTVIEEPNELALLNVPDNISVINVSFLKENEPGFNGKTIAVKFREMQTAAPVSTSVDMGTPAGAYRFHIIGGCFQYIANAEKLVLKLKRQGKNAGIIDKHKGLYRVSIQSFISRPEARKALPELRVQHNTQAWMLVK